MSSRIYESNLLVFCTSGCFLFFHDDHKKLLDYLLEVAGDNDILIAVNSDEYLLEKHSKLIDDILEKEPDVLNRLSLANELSAEYRASKVQEHVQGKALVVVNDNILDDLNSKLEPVWVVGPEYIKKNFKEKEKVNFILIRPGKESEHSSDKLLELKENLC